jgi:endonuclease VIII
MPEGDTLFRIGAALTPVLVGQEAELHLPHRTAHERVVVSRVHVHGKNLLVVFSDERALHTHLRMRGLWHVYLRGQPWRRPRHLASVILTTARHEAVCFEVPNAVILSPLATRRFVARLPASIDILSDVFDAEAAAERIRCAPHAAIAIALLDQQLIAGIGNVYKSEALFAARVHPEHQCQKLDALKTLELVRVAQTMMRANVSDIHTDSPGAHYRYQRTTRSGCEVGKGTIAVYGRQGRDCYTCGSAIVMIRQGDQLRSTYFCPFCQRL